MNGTSARVLRAVGDLLQERTWDDVSLAQVAAAAGVSRQTVYNEFGSRSALAQLHVEGLVDRLLPDQLPDDLLAAVQDRGLAAVVEDVLSSWLTAVHGDASLRSTGGTGLFRGTVVDETELVGVAARRLAERYCGLVPGVEVADALVLARVVVRQALSYLLVPPGESEAPAADLAALLTPYVERVLAQL